MTKKEVTEILIWGNSHSIPVEGLPIRVTRIQAFLSIAPLLKGKLYWYALRFAYDDSDNLYAYRHDIKIAFQSNKPEREYLMNSKERKYLKNLPDQITIYRGMTLKEFRSKNFGISWTLKSDIAAYFANTYGRNYATNHLKKTVHKLVINKSEVIAFFNGRKEYEIIFNKSPWKPQEGLLSNFT